MIFVDTGALYSRVVARDNHHPAAVEHWKVLEKTRPALITTNSILYETATLLMRKINPGDAVQYMRELLEAESLEVFRSDEELDQRAMHFFSKYADQRLNFVDCVSFACMKWFKIADAFTFDRHFAIAGFHGVPE